MTNKRLPRYIKLAHQIEQTIRNGALTVGSTLPPQRALAQQYGTTLMTLRKALQLLEEEGLVRSEHGVGTFVLNPQLQEEDVQLFGLSKSATSSKSHSIETQIINSDDAWTNFEAAQLLNVTSDGSVGMIERVRLLDNVPFMVQRSYLPADLAHLVTTYQAEQSLYDFIQQETAVAVTTAEERVEPMILSTHQANLLQLAPQTAAWQSVRLSRNQNGRAILYDIATLHPNFFSLSLQHNGKRTVCEFGLRLAGDSEQ